MGDASEIADSVSTNRSLKCKVCSAQNTRFCCHTRAACPDRDSERLPAGAGASIGHRRDAGLAFLVRQLRPGDLGELPPANPTPGLVI